MSQDVLQPFFGIRVAIWRSFVVPPVWVVLTGDRPGRRDDRAANAAVLAAGLTPNVRGSALPAN